MTMKEQAIYKEGLNQLSLEAQQLEGIRNWVSKNLNDSHNLNRQE